MIGKMVAHYQIIGKIGEGGMGVVYKAEDTALQRTVALKFLSTELTRDAEAKQRFLREARAAAQLDHPNICAVHEIAETEEGSLYIVMACYVGETLRERLRRGPLSCLETAGLVIQAADGLAHAHGRGLVHRDVKPANLFVTADGKVKLLDFGLARHEASSIRSKSRMVAGTAAYMSPEQVQGDRVDHRTDIWSLGVVLYEAIGSGSPYSSSRRRTTRTCGRSNLTGRRWMS